MNERPSKFLSALRSFFLDGQKDAKSLFVFVLLLLFIRGFLAEPFKIPSGSLIPSLLVGDHLFVAKTSYSIGFPFTNWQLIKVSDPKRGEIIVFKYPNVENDPAREGLYYIKRLIGVPGDKIRLSNGVIYINGEEAVQTESDFDPKQLPGVYQESGYKYYLEKLPGTKNPHWMKRHGSIVENFPSNLQEYQKYTQSSCLEVGKRIFNPMIPSVMVNEICEFTLPEGQYFFVGDNRDSSSDGRDWGFVDYKFLVGKALFVWFSLRPENEGGLAYNDFENNLGILGHVVHFFRGLVYDLTHPSDPKYIRWERLGKIVK